MALTSSSYNVGHPWYYLLGGEILKPKAIMAQVKASGYRGYRADEIDAADRLPEPKRSQRLRRFEQEVRVTLQRDLRRYRALACELRSERLSRGIPECPTVCNGLHTAISLKYAHVYNGFAHLEALSCLSEHQMDLF